jgi:hypothetical protein
MSRSDTTATPYVMPLIDVLDLLDTTRGDDAPPLRARVRPARGRTQSDWPLSPLGGEPGGDHPEATEQSG